MEAKQRRCIIVIALPLGHSTIGYLSPLQYEVRAMKAQVPVHEAGSSSHTNKIL